MSFLCFSRPQNKDTLTTDDGLGQEGEKFRGTPPYEGGLESTFDSEEGRGLPRTTPPLEANAAKPSWLILTDIKALDYK